MIPTVYTEATLADYMHRATKEVANAVGWSVDSYEEAIIDTLIAYGATALSDATDIPKLRALAKVAAWAALVDATAADYAFSVDGGSYNRNQLHEQAVAALQRATEAASAYASADTGYTIGQGSMVFKDTYARYQ